MSPPSPAPPSPAPTTAPRTQRAAAQPGDARSLRRWFLLLLALCSAARLAFATSLPLSGDEAYHWEWSRRLAPAYWDHPGMTALLIALGRAVASAHSELSVRLPAVLCLAATAELCYRFARDVARRAGQDALSAARAGFLAGLLVLLTPVLALFAVYMSTDPPWILFHALTWYLLFLGVEHGTWRAWLGAGVAGGLAMASKFLAFFMLPAAAAVLLLHRPYRPWLRRPQAWVAAAVAVAVFAPVLWWNATHGWATFRFNLVERNRDAEFSLLLPIEVVVSQLGVLSPLVCIAMVPAARAAWRRWRTAREGAAILLGLAAAVPMAFLLLTSFWRRIGVHWTAAAWVPGLVWLAVWWSRIDSADARALRWRRRTLISVVALTVPLHFVAHVPASWTDFDLAYFGRPDKIRLRAFDERFGWRELGQWIEATRAEMQAAPPQTPVFPMSDQYGVAALGAFYMPSQPVVHLWSPPTAHGQSYRAWDDFAALRGQNAVLFGKRRERLESALAVARRHFDRVGPIEDLDILQDGEPVRSFHLVRCYGFDGEQPY